LETAAIFVAVFRLLTETKPITSPFWRGAPPNFTRDLKKFSSRSFLFCPSPTLYTPEEKIIVALIVHWMNQEVLLCLQNS
jgi:hypothetical protein